MSHVRTSAYFKRKMKLTNTINVNILTEESMEHLAQQIEEAFLRGASAGRKENPDPTGARDDVSLAGNLPIEVLAKVYVKSKGYRP